jgi:hypothetical protein
MAALFGKACEDEGDQGVVKAVTRKCMEVIGDLKKLAGDTGITADKFPAHIKPALKSFLFNFAAAENMVA